MIRFGRRLLPSSERLQRSLDSITFDFWLDEMRIDAKLAKLAKRCQSGINCGVGNWGIPLIRVFHSIVKCIYNTYSGLKRVPHNEAQQELRSVQKISGDLNFSTEFDRARLGLRLRGID